MDLTLDLDLEMEWLAYMASKPQGAGRVGSRRSWSWRNRAGAGGCPRALGATLFGVRGPAPPTPSVPPFSGCAPRALGATFSGCPRALGATLGVGAGRSTCEGCPRALGATLFGVRAPLYDKCHHGACCKPVLSLFLCSTVCMAGNGLRCDECGAAFTGRPIQPLQTLSVLCSTVRTTVRTVRPNSLRRESGCGCA